MDSDIYLYDVLKTFAQGIGFEITENLTEYKERMKKYRADDWINDVEQGSISFDETLIYIKPTEDRIAMANTIAHELGHYYHAFCLDSFAMWDQRETVAELAAAYVLKYFGIDTIEKSIRYAENCNGEVTIDKELFADNVHQTIIEDLVIFLEDSHVSGKYGVSTA